MSAAEAAARLGLPVRTLLEQARAGAFPACVGKTGAPAFWATDVELHLAQRQENDAPADLALAPADGPEDAATVVDGLVAWTWWDDPWFRRGEVDGAHAAPRKDDLQAVEAAG